jgi:dimethylhistidine N-methyltransferase
MTRVLTPPPALRDFGPGRDRMLAEVLAGLRGRRKRLPCKYFYDAEGSRLFDRICELPEYYLTRTELGIMRRHAGEMADAIGAQSLLIEYGSGSSIKTRLLLDRLESPAGYVPIDISGEHLTQSAHALARAYPHVDVLPVCADYTTRFHVPEPDADVARRAVYFPGSTIGNFEPDDALKFLREVARVCGSGGGLLIGVDLKKDPAALHAAYNDAAGITAAFNLNLLARLNRDLGADFDVSSFAHYAFYNPRRGRIEMHLVSRAPQRVGIDGATIPFAEGESIFTESSYKYTLLGFTELAKAAGFTPQKVWTDEDRRFSIHFLTCEASENQPRSGERM